MTHVRRRDAAAAAAAGRSQPRLAAWTRSRVLRDIPSPSHTHKQTIKVNHFLLTSKLKLSVPRGGVRFIGVLCAYDSFITEAMKTEQARGALLFTLQPLATIPWYKSFLPSSWPGRFPRVSAGLLILAPFMLGWTG